MDLSLDITAAANATYVTVAGEIDLANHGELERTLQQLGADRRHVELDLRGVTFIDSSGLRILVEAHRARIDADASLTLRSPSAAVQRLLEISGLSSHLDVSG